jgi:phytoene desaturase
MKTAAVIGSGFGGLAAAVRLRARGYRVHVLEATGQPGGRASVFLRDGHVFDAGPTVITAPYLLHELFDLLGEDSRDYFELLPIDPFYRIEYPDGSRFDYVGDEKRLLENIRALSPDDVENYKRLAEHAERIFEIGYVRLADQPFHRLTDMLRIVPQMLRLQNYRSVYGLVSHYIKDERLRQAFSFEPLLVGGNPMTITSIYLLIHWLERKWGVHFAKGGTTSIVEGLRKLLEKKGVEFHFHARVDHLQAKEGRIRQVFTSDGKVFPVDLVVSNADPIQTYKSVDPRYRPINTDRRLNSMKQSMGLFVLYFGTRKTYPHLVHHTIILGPRYEGLLKDIFKHQVLSKDFSLYLHAPTRTDASLAPSGCETFYVLAPVPNNQSGINWKEEGPALEARILDFLDRTHIPGLKENLTVKFHLTPDYFEHTLLTTDGSGFGLEPRLTQSAYFRFHNQSPDLENLYFVGASTHPGAGIPGVLSSAKVLERILPQESSWISSQPAQI